MKLSFGVLAALAGVNGKIIEIFNYKSFFFDFWISSKFSEAQVVCTQGTTKQLFKAECNAADGFVITIQEVS